MLLAFLRSSFSSPVRQVAPGEDDDRRLAQARASAWMFAQQSKPDMSGKPQIEHHAVEAAAAHGSERCGTGGAARGDLDVAVSSSSRDAHLLGGIVLDHQQAADARRR